MRPRPYHLLLADGAPLTLAAGPATLRAKRLRREGRSYASRGRRGARGTVRVRVPWPDGPTRVFDLEQPRTAEMPIHPAHEQAGYSYLLHRRHEDEYRPDENGPRTGAAGIIICAEHTGTHIDALCPQSDAPGAGPLRAAHPPAPAPATTRIASPLSSEPFPARSVAGPAASVNDAPSGARR